MGVQVLKQELIKLSKVEQAEIMHFMVELLTTDNFELSKEWSEELSRREKNLENGTSVGCSARSVIAKYYQ